MNWSVEISSDSGPMIDWTTPEYQLQLQREKRIKVMKFNERTASFSLEQSAAQTKQEDLKATNHKTIDDEFNSKQSVNSDFWHRVMNVMTLIAIAIVAYTLFHFA